jgi:type IV pilus assembly protein PilA
MSHSMTKRKAQGGWRGFSLIELLLVVAIVLVVAVIAIPNLLRARASASESSGVQSLRTLVNAEHVYSTEYGNGFSPDLPTLAGAGAATCDTARLVDSVLAAGHKGNYQLTYAGGSAMPTSAPGCTNPGFSTFQLQADPGSAIIIGQRHFFTNEAGVIRQNATAPATVTDPPIS